MDLESIFKTGKIWRSPEKSGEMVSLVQRHQKANL